MSHYCLRTNRVFFLLILITVKKSLFSTANYDCISQCICKFQNNTVVADCTAATYHQIPQSHWKWVFQINKLIVDYNKVTIIRPDDFINFKELNDLQLQGNQLRFIDSNAFVPLKKQLTRLDLSKNALTSKALSCLSVISSNLKTLSLAYNQLKSVPSSLQNMTNLIEIDLSHNKIKVIPENFLLASLITANFSFNTLQRFEKNIFAKSKSLKVLILSDNEASSDVRFLDNVFDPLINLQHLDLSRCYCRRLPQLSFKTMSKLTTLKLQRSFLYKLPLFESPLNMSRDITTNQNSSLVASTVWNNPQLETLDLSLNSQLRFDSSGPTPFPPSLRILDLSSDRIRMIDEKFLENLQNLQTLRLDNNRIVQVADRAFINMTRLINISMTWSQLDVMPQLPVSLQSLKLPGSEITNLTTDRMSDLTQIRTIDLSNSQVTNIENGLFTNMSELKTLNLSSNKLMSLNDEVFRIKSGADLTYLDLQKNEIQQIKGSPFATHDRLNELYIHQNHLTVIETHTLKGLDSLRVLDLSVNDIEDVSSDALSNLLHLEVLRLDNNRMEVVWENQFKQLTRLHTLTLHTNHLIKMDPQTFPSITSLSLVDNQLSSIPLLNAPKLTELLISKNQLTKIDEDSFFNVKNLEYIDLDSNSMLILNNFNSFEVLKNLSYLNIGNSTLNSFVNVLLPKLRTLSLESTQITSELIVNKSFVEVIPSIEDINLSYNNIIYINPKAFDQLNALKSVDLQGNNFGCTCKLQPFVDWYNSRHNQLDFVAADFFLCEEPEQFYAVHVFDAMNELNCSEIITTTAATTTIKPSSKHSYLFFSLIPIISIIFAIFIIILVTRRCRRLSRDQNSSQRDEIRLGGGEGLCYGCCISLFKINIARSSAGAHRLNSDEDQQDLMAPSLVTSPLNADAPVEL